MRWVFENFWSPIGAGVKSQEEVDALVLYLFSDDEGCEQLRSIDRSVSELLGLEGLTLFEDVLDTASTRRASQPGNAGSVAAARPAVRAVPVAMLG